VDIMHDELKQLRALINQWEINTNAPINWNLRQKWIDAMLDIVDALIKESE
jgi:hypothetical protein